MAKTRYYEIILTEAERDMLFRLVRNGWGDGSYGENRLSASEHAVVSRLFDKLNKNWLEVSHG